MYLSGVLFLKFKDLISDKDSIYDTILNDIVKFIFTQPEINYHQELVESLYLLGVFYGYKKFYDDYYEDSGLRFIRSETLKKNRTFKYFANKELIEQNRIKEMAKTEEQETLPVSDDHSSGLEEPIDKIEKPIDQSENGSVAPSPKEVVLEQLLKYLKDQKSKGVKIESQVLTDFKEIFKPLAGDKPTRDRIVEIIKSDFKNEINVKGKSVTLLMNSTV